MISVKVEKKTLKILISFRNVGGMWVEIRIWVRGYCKSQAVFRLEIEYNLGQNSENVCSYCQFVWVRERLVFWLFIAVDTVQNFNNEKRNCLSKLLQMHNGMLNSWELYKTGKVIIFIANNMNC